MYVYRFYNIIFECLLCFRMHCAVLRPCVARVVVELWVWVVGAAQEGLCHPHIVDPPDARASSTNFTETGLGSSSRRRGGSRHGDTSSSTNEYP